MTKSTYDKIEAYFKQHKGMLKLLKFTYKYVPLVVFIAYPLMVIILLFTKGITSVEFLKVFFVPFGTFVVVTIARKLFNFQRPYEKYDIHPLIQKNKQGQSFPSRHSVSIFIIAMAYTYINVYVGIVFILLGIVIGVTRVLAGVHFIRDVFAGAVISILIGTIFLFLI